MSSRRTVFISYNHNDRSWLKRLRIHLRPIERELDVTVWADTRLEGGDHWRDEIEAALHSAAVAILLISADFLASDFIAENELPTLLERARHNGTDIIPVIV